MFPSLTHLLFLTVLTTIANSLQDVGGISKDQLLSASIPSESSTMVNAVLLECPKGRKHESQTNKGSKQRRNPCQQQLMVNIRVNPSFHIQKMEKFLVLDEVYDPRKRTKAKIMSPYLIEISRGEPVMMFPLEFSKSVQIDEDKNDTTFASGKPTDAKCKMNHTNEKSEITNETKPKGTEYDFNRKNTDRPETSTKVFVAMCESNNTSINPDPESTTKSCEIKSDLNQIKQEKAEKTEKTEKTKNTEKTENAENENDAQIDKLNFSADDESLSKVIDKIAEVFAPATKIITSNKKSVHDYNDESKAKIMYPKLNYDLDIPIAFKKKQSTRQSQEQKPMAYVKIGDRVLKDQKSRNLAALGRVRFSSNLIRSPDEDKKNVEENYKNKDGDTILHDCFKEPSSQQLLKGAISNGFQQSAGQNSHSKFVHLKHTFNNDEEDSDNLFPRMQDFEPESNVNNDEISPTNPKERSFIKQHKHRHGRRRHKKRRKGRIRYRPRTHKHDSIDKPLLDDNNFSNKNEDFHDSYENERCLNILDGSKMCNCKTKNELKSDNENNSNNNYIDTDDFADYNNAQIIPCDNELNKNSNPLPWNQEYTYDNNHYNKFNEFNNYPKRRQYFLDKRRHLEAISKKVKKYTNPRNFKVFRVIHDPHSSFDPSGNMRFYVNDLMERHFKKQTNRVQPYMRGNNLHIGRAKLNLYKSSNSEPINNYNGNRKFEQQFKNKINIDVNTISSKNQNKGLVDNQSKRIINNEMNKNRGTHFTREEINPLEGIHSSANNMLMTSNVVVNPHFNKVNNVKNNNGMLFNSLWNDVSPTQSFTPTYNKDYPEQSDHTSSNDYMEHTDYTARLQPPRSTARELINKEPAKFLPKNPPFSKIIDDPNLNVNDKLRILDVLDPHDAKSDQRLSQLRNEVEHSFIYQVTPFPLPYDSAQDNTKKKRSFLFYDDMEIRDTSDDNDFKFDKIEQKRSPHTSEERVEEDVQPCATCGGKGKKPQGKTDALYISDHARHIEDDDQPCSSCGGKGKKVNGKTTTFNGACKCRSQRAKCSCRPSKMVRSVSETCIQHECTPAIPHDKSEHISEAPQHLVEDCTIDNDSLSSLSGIFANANLSILFSSHVDIFQLEKSLRLQNHQLLIPKDDRPVRENTYSEASTKHYRNDKNTFHDVELANLNALNLNPNTILAVDSSKYKVSYLARDAGQYIKLTRDEVKRVSKRSSVSKSKVDIDLIDSITNIKPMIYQRNVRSLMEDGIQTIAELGYFPATMNILEQCPYDKNRLCLNMLDDKVPAYSIKVKMPFRENSIIHKSVFKVKIARIISDATTKDALQVSVDVINEGMEAAEFSICVCNCPMACATAAKTTVKKFLLPHLGETVTFLLPLIMESNQKHKQFNCDVIIKTIVQNATSNMNRAESVSNKTLISKRDAETTRDSGEKNKIVAIRSMIVDPEGRCFCVWDCGCHCIPKLETHVDFNLCKKLTFKEQKDAGLLLQCPPGENGGDTCLNDADEDVIEQKNSYRSFKLSFGSYEFLKNALMLIIFMLILGLLKAIIGRICSTRIDKCGYGYVQPGKGYDNSSKCRRFFVNLFFFIVFPFLFWCKCFTPSEEDLLVASTEWQCSIVQDSRNNMDRSGGCGSCATGGMTGRSRLAGGTTGRSTDDEDVILSQHIDLYSKSSNKTENRLVGGQDVFDMENRLTNLTMAFHEGVFDDEEDEDEEANTKFILQALVESRESLKKLLRNHSSTQLESTQDDCEKLKQASDLVTALKSAQIVYRIFDRPIGNIRNIPFGKKYCIQGYFLPSLGAEYEFVNYHPLAQHRCFSLNGEGVEVVRPPVILCSKEFGRIYGNKTEVFEAADLSVNLPENVPCINISTMAAVASSVAKLASDQDYRVPLDVGDRSNISNYSYPVNSKLALQLEDAEEEIDDNVTTSRTEGFYCSIDIDDESQEIIEESISEITAYKFDTIIE